jgi:hypothetical protein
MICNLYDRYVLVIGFRLWARTSEVLNLRSTHAAFDLVSVEGHEYHKLRLSNRKTTIDDAVGTFYNMYATAREPAADPLRALNRWKKFYLNYLSKHCGRVGSQDYGSDEVLASKCTVPKRDPGKGKVYPGVSPTDVEMQQLLDIIVEEVGLMRGRNGKYTTRCCRRGGGILLIYKINCL